eukprot:GHVO01053347.1.p1 GENE.GHVO01053347.1~~GHVO01053347.1.p1  ORF type:complete len:248 (+),score=45.91 GHVO01053347.1:136-879(+)
MFPEAQVSGQGAVVCFTVEGDTTVPDRQPHKVTISSFDMDTGIISVVMPSVSPHALLQISNVNTCPYPLVACAHASVFVDGSLVAKTSIPEVSPNQSFRLSLGIDTGIRVENRPDKERSKTGGIISSWKSTTVDCVCVLTNTRRTPGLVAVMHTLPKSTDEKLKVKTLKPSKYKSVKVSSDEEVAHEEIEKQGRPSSSVSILNSRTNNIITLMPIAAGAEEVVTFSYSIEHPLNREVVTKEEIPTPA